MLHSQIPANKIVQGSVPLTKSYALAYNTTGVATGVKLITIRASTKRPVLLSAQIAVETAFNAVSTNVLAVGTTGTGGEIIPSASITEGTPAFYPSAPTQTRLTANTPIYVSYTQTGTAATTGAARVYLTVTPLF